MSDKDKLSCYITAEDPRYPILVIQNGYQSAGYSLDRDTLTLKRICICAAHEAGECCCGAWDNYEEDDYDA